jgi:acetoin utilization deacetylase AcuC-like enzyme
LIDADGNYHRYNPANAKRPLKVMFDRSLRAQAGSYQCCREALERGFCFSLSGGGHHAHRDFGHGFCTINDIVIPLRKLQAESRIKTAWIIDVDAHKGDGVAAITQGDESIITLSSHMAHGWPLDLPETLDDGSPNPVYTPSDIDIPIEHGEEGLYCARLLEGLERLDTFPRPDLALVELGADPYEKDGLPSTELLQLNLRQMFERDMLIYNFLEERNIPGAYLMSGGYGEHSWEPYPPFLKRVLKQRLGL